jgi:hypothetical protein
MLPFACFAQDVARVLAIESIVLKVCQSVAHRHNAKHAGPGQSGEGACRFYYCGDLVKTMDHVFIVYRGMIYTQQPTWLTVTHHWWSKYLRKLGLAGHEMPVIAVAATASCNAERLPWAEFRASNVPQRYWYASDERRFV